MKRLIFSFVALVSLVEPTALRAQQSPIIDRNLFFGEIEIAGAQISPDGQYLSFLKPYKGTRNIWVKKASDPFTAARPVSAEATRPVRAYFWSRDSKYILYSQDAAGDENFNIYAIDPTLPADAKTGVPLTRALTNLKGVRTEIYAVPKSKPDILYIGLNDRDPRWHDLYELHLSTGEKKLIRKNTEQIAGWEFDHDGNLRLAERTNQVGDTEILRVDPDGLKQIYSCTVLESCGVRGFDATNKQVYLTTNKGSLDLTELDLMDAGTGTTTQVESDPEKRVDIRNMELSDVDYRILFTEYEDDRVRLYFKDKTFEKEYRWLQTKLSGEEIGFGARSKDENIWIVNCLQRHGTRRNLPMEPPGEDAGAAVPHPRRTAPHVALGAQAVPLQVVGRSRYSSLPDAAERPAGEEPAADRFSAWRPVGSRLVRLRYLCPIPV